MSNDEVLQAFQVLLEEIKGVREDLTAEINNVRAELKAEIKIVREELADFRDQNAREHAEFKEMLLKIPGNMPQFTRFWAATRWR